MTEKDSGRKPEEVLKYLDSRLDSAYDLGSGGMGIHMNALSRLAMGKEIPDRAYTSLSISGSNFIGNPYVIGWYRPDSGFGGPIVECPDAEPHKRLINNIYLLYNELDRKTIRLALLGENELAENVSGEEFDRESFLDLIRLASKRGQIRLFTDFETDFTPPQSSFDFMTFALRTEGVEVEESFLDDFIGIKTTDVFRNEVISAAAHKLAAMLAVSDQITFEAKQLGSPVSFDYRPDRAEPGGKWRKNWKKYLDEEMPTFGQLYINGHEILTATEIDDNSLFAHVLRKPKLDQLV